MKDRAAWELAYVSIHDDSAEDCAAEHESAALPGQLPQVAAIMNA
jgi:hypothetical protein